MYIECININKNINEYYQLYKTVNEKNSNIINTLICWCLVFMTYCTNRICGVFILIPVV